MVREASSAYLGIVSLSTLVKDLEEVMYETVPKAIQTVKRRMPNEIIILEPMLFINSHPKPFLCI